MEVSVTFPIQMLPANASPPSLSSGLWPVQCSEDLKLSSSACLATSSCYCTRVPASRWLSKRCADQFKKRDAGSGIPSSMVVTSPRLLQGMSRHQVSRTRDHMHGLPGI